MVQADPHPQHYAPWTALRTTCLPSSHAVLVVHRKNCEPLVFAPALAMDRMPARAAAGRTQGRPDRVPRICCLSLA